MSEFDNSNEPEDTEDLDGFGGTFSDFKYDEVGFPKGGTPGSFVHRPVAHAKLGNKSARGGGVYFKIHFGYKGRSMSDPDKLVYRTIACLEDKKGAQIIQDCPLCTLRAPYQAKVDRIAAVGKETKKTKDQIKKAQAPYKEWLSNHGLDKKMKIPGIGLNGRPQVCRIPYGAFIDYTNKGAKLSAKGINAVGTKGVFFEFTRSGQASRDSDSCEVLRDEDDKMVMHTITADIAKTLLEALPNLTDELKKITYSYEQLEQLAKLTRGDDGYDPDEVDRILGFEHKPRAERQDDSDDAGDEAPVAATTTDEDEDFAVEEKEEAPKVEEKPKAAPKAAAKAEEKPKAAPKVEEKPKAAAKPAAEKKAEPAPATEDDGDLDELFGD